MHRYKEDDECFSLFCKENVKGLDSQRMNQICNNQPRLNAESVRWDAAKTTVRKKQGETK
jgi:hypothetical protein